MNIYKLISALRNPPIRNLGPNTVNLATMGAAGLPKPGRRHDYEESNTIEI